MFFFRSTIILVGVYHHQKKMVVDTTSRLYIKAIGCEKLIHSWLKGKLWLSFTTGLGIFSKMGGDKEENLSQKCFDHSGLGIIQKICAQM